MKPKYTKLELKMFEAIQKLQRETIPIEVVRQLLESSNAVRKPKDGRN